MKLLKSLIFVFLISFSILNSYSTTTTPVPTDPLVASYQERLDAQRAALAAATIPAAQAQAQSALDATQQEIVSVYQQNPQLFTQSFYEISDLTPQEKHEISTALAGGSECSSSMWGFLCTANAQQQREDLYVERYTTQISQDLGTTQLSVGTNTIIVNNLVTEINDLPGMTFTSSQCSSADFNGCRSSIVNYECGGNSDCETSKDIALAMYDASENYYQIEANGIIKFAQFLQVDSGSYFLANTITNLLGVDLSLIKEGSALDQIFKWGTPEQVCLAKVESFISVEGAEYTGSQYDVTDEYTGMTSRQKMCDDLTFTVCADLRAERTGVFFNDSFSLIVHLYVYNSEDYDQDIVLSAELIDNSGRSQKFNVFNESGQFGGNISQRLSSGQTFSGSIYIPELQAFNGTLDGNLLGNVLLTVHEAGSGSLTSQTGFEYALDYPIVEMNSGPLSQSELIDSGVSYLEGTSIYNSDLVDRIVVD